MGKVGAEEDQALPITHHDSNQNVDPTSSSSYSSTSGFHGICSLIGLRCILVLLLSSAVFLSAVFWLPPFLHFSDQGYMDLDPRFKGHDIVARFSVRKSVDFLVDNILQLEDDIFDEISYPNTKVIILSLEPLTGPNITKVVFGVDPDAKYSKLSSTAQSLIRSSFEFLVVNQSFHLTKLFGDPFSFEVLKFPGGITIIPPQRAFLLQKVQISFNFTLNFSLYQLQVNFAELTSQLKGGLHLAPYENLYIILSNSKGSTVAPPTTVQSSVVMAVGNPSMGRLKQLAQTISGHSRNLGLNNTVFGKVKQVRLSSLPHSFHSGGGSASPSPAPLPHSRHRNHHHHHHRHHHHDAYIAPLISPVPATEESAPAPLAKSPASLASSPAPHNSKAKPPGCQLGHSRYPENRRKHSPLTLAPMVSPNTSPHVSTPSPQLNIGSPSVSPTPRPISQTVPVSSPLPNVIFAHVQPPRPPSKAKPGQHSAGLPLSSRSPFSYSADIRVVQWAASLSLAIVLHL